MTIDVTNGEINLSGTVTRDNLIALDTGTSGSPVTVTDNITVKLNMPVSVESGTVLQLQGLVILVNNQSIGYAALAGDEGPPVFEGVTFVYNIRSHWSVRALAVKNCVVVSDKSAGIFGVTSADNLVLQSNISGSNPGGELFFGGGGVFRNIDFYSTGRLGIEGNSSGASSFWLKNMAYHGQEPIRIGYNHAPSSIWEDFVAPDAPAGASGWNLIDTYRASSAPHTIMLLGESVETFYRGGTGFNVTNQHANTHIITGGIKYWKAVGSSAAKLWVYDNRSNNSQQRCLPSLDQWDLLETATDIAVPENGELTFILTKGRKADISSESTQLIELDNQKVVISDYGFLSYLKDYNNVTADVVATEGSEAARNPVVLEQDSNITETDASVVAAYSEIANLDQLYDYLAWLETETPHVRGTAFLRKRFVAASGKALVIPDGWTLVRDQTIGNVASYDPASRIIRIKTAATGLTATDRFNTLIGTVDASWEGFTTARYLKANGKVDVTVALTEDQDIQAPVVGIWPKADGFANRSNIVTAAIENGAATFTDLEPQTDYHIVLDGVGAWRQESEFNTGEYGTNPPPFTLERIRQVDGTALLPAILTTQQRRIANMFAFNPATLSTDISLPADYETDDRWDADNSIWTFTEDDFIAIAYRVEEIQSAAISLRASATIRIDNYALTLKSDSMFTLSQAADNADAVININAFTITREGDDTQLKTYLNHANGVLNTNAGNPVIATLSTPSSVLESVTDQIPAKVNEATDIQAIKVYTERLTEVRAEVLDSLIAMISNNRYTGDALANAPEETAAEARDHARAANVQTQEE